MTIEQLMQITKSIDNNYQKFHLCKLEHNIQDMDDIIEIYNDSLSAIYGCTAPYFTFDDRFFEEDDDGTIYSWSSEDDIIEAYYFPDTIAEAINKRIDIKSCNTKKDIFIKLGIDI